MNISGHGISVDLPPEWEGRIYRRREGFPILHAGSFVLPHGDGDFGSSAIEAMSDGDVFFALLGYDPALAGTALFNQAQIPLPVHATQLSPAAFRRRIPGRLGVQLFFTEQARPFCLYVVLGSNDLVPPRGSLREANKILRTVRIAPRGAQ